MLAQEFFQVPEEYLQTISNIKTLIHPLSIIAQEIRSKTLNLLNNAGNPLTLSRTQNNAILFLKKVQDDFKKSMFNDEIENEEYQFADLFAQSIIYGEFSAWIKFCQTNHNPQDFTLQIVDEYLPYGTFLRDLFLNFKTEIPKEFEGILNELINKFQITGYPCVISNTESLITTFYSDFLQLYDPTTAKDRGVVYTPQEIVEYMVHGIDFNLKQWLNKPDGIISIPKDKDQLCFLDPAAGTMAFACGLLHAAKEKFIEAYSNSSTEAEKAFQSWVESKFFESTYGFEILTAPYLLGQIRTFLTLENLGMPLNSADHHLKSYLMNTLILPSLQSNVNDIVFKNLKLDNKLDQTLTVQGNPHDIIVIMGNPPYNLSSLNNCEWINREVLNYKKGLKEKNQKILADDYVKFIRFGQWKIEQIGSGILAFITNNRFLDGQMFSVMRKSLRKTFDHIYIVNLHGDMRKKESGNPFDIRVGVAISFMVRIDNSPNKNAVIHYMDVPYSTREEKFECLSKGFDEGSFKLLSETKENFFVDIDTTLLNRFEQFLSIDALFYSSPTSGIMIGRDKLLVDVDQAVLEHNLTKFFEHNFDELETLGINTKDTKTWSSEEVLTRTTLETAYNSIRKIYYRGFDYRYIAYERNMVEGHRMGYIDRINRNNPAITVTKSSRKKSFETALVVDDLLEKCFMSVTDTAYAFPLFLNDKLNLQCPELPYPVDPNQVFYYIYGILNSPLYRKRYDEYLRKMFPRIPFPKEEKKFQEMAALGEQLANLHLMHEPIPIKLELSETPPDKWIIRNYTYSASENTLYFDDPTKYSVSNNMDLPWIKGITPDVWAYSIGCIPQLEQFLESRKFSATQKWNCLQRGLNHEELLHFLKLATIFNETLQILPKIDITYQKIDILDPY